MTTNTTDALADMNKEADMNKDDLPGGLALAKAVVEGKWPHTMDAAVWAKEFAKVFPMLYMDGSCVTDVESHVLCWFANAIMAGYDTANHRRAEVLASAPPASTVPAGYALVPVEPTASMWESARQAIGPRHEDHPWPFAWNAMLASAPQPPAVMGPGWRPIAELKSNGDLVMFAEPGRYLGTNRADDYYNGAYWLKHATHYQPLPPPPADKEGQDK